MQFLERQPIEPPLVRPHPSNVNAINPLPRIATRVLCLARRGVETLCTFVPRGQVFRMKYTSTPDAIERLTFGMVPVAEDTNTRLRLADFCSLLGHEVGATVLPHVAPSPSALASAVHAGRVHVAWLSPTLLASSPLVAGAVPLVSSVREGVASYHSVLFVRASSRMQCPADLQGARIAWVAPTSAGGYVFPRISLTRHGLDLSTLFASEKFYDSHSRVAEAVANGEADVGATFATFRNADPTEPLTSAGFPLASPVRIIDVAGPIPADVIAASPGVSAAVRASLAHALMALLHAPEGRAVIQSLFSVEAFQPFSPDALTELRALLRCSAMA